MNKIFVLLTFIISSCSSYSQVENKSNSNVLPPPYTINEWQPNWSITLPDSLNNNLITGSVWLSIKFDKESLLITDVAIASLSTKDKLTNKIVYQFKNTSPINYINQEYPTEINKYYLYFKVFCNKLTISRNFTNTSDLNYKNEILFRLLF